VGPTITLAASAKRKKPLPLSQLETPYAAFRLRSLVTTPTKFLFTFVTECNYKTFGNEISSRVADMRNSPTALMASLYFL